MATLAKALIVSAICAFAQSPDWKSAIQARLLSQYSLTKAEQGSSGVRVGSVLALRKEGLGLYSTKATLGYTPTNTYADGIIKPELSALLSRKVREGTARIFAAGDRLYVFKIDVKNDAVVFDFLSEPVNEVQFWGTLRFPFPKGSPPSPEQVAQTVGQVFSVDGSPADANNTTLAGAPRDFPTPVSPAPNSSRPQDLTVDVAALSVAGVKLGMTPDEAIEALKKFEPWPILTKRYWSGADIANAYGALGHSADCEGSKKQFQQFKILIAIVAAKSNRTPGQCRDCVSASFRRTTLSPDRQAAADAAAMACDWAGAPGSQPGEDPMEVYVYFNPTPGSERVIGVTIWRSFGSPTPVRAVIDSAREKYTIEPTSSGTSQQAFLAWRFDGRDRPMSEAAASRAGLLGSRAMGTSLPKTVNNTDGVGLDVDVVRDPHNQELAQSYSVSLYRGSDLFSFAPQAQAAYSAAEKARKEQELDKAKDSGTKIKM